MKVLCKSKSSPEIESIIAITTIIIFFIKWTNKTLMMQFYETLILDSWHCPGHSTRSIPEPEPPAEAAGTDWEVTIRIIVRHTVKS